MTLNEYQHLAMRTNVPHDTRDAGLTNAALGLAGEAGEFADLVKKFLFQGHEKDREHLMRELGDVLWYIAQACEYLGCSMDEVAQGNIYKLLKRYPNGFEKEKSTVRAAGDL